MATMTFADPTRTREPARTAASANPPAETAGSARARDLRLDFFRGLAMFIILMAHTPGNIFSLWIPARWGFSDATEIFVFCSGMASAIAFGRAFDTAGWRLGTARVAYRVWQVYWAHVGLFFATLALTVFLTDLDGSTRNYWGQLNLWPIFVESEQWENSNILLSFMTLTYVPNYFDILPMYMAVLVAMPLLVALGRVHLGLAAGFVVIVWILAQESITGALGLPHLAFPAEPWSDRNWFFNPFGWQLIFFTGFAFMRGWLPKPPVHPVLVVLALVIVLGSIPLSNIGVRELDLEWARAWRDVNAAWFNKSDFGILRYVHFLSLAYLCWVAAGDKGNRLLTSGAGVLARLWQGLLSVILKVGQQSLAVFVVSMFIARLMGFVMDELGRDFLITLAVNLAGAGVLVATAYCVGWFKSEPWRQVKAK